VNKRERKRKEQSRIGNPETLATVCQQDTRRRKLSKTNTTPKTKMTSNTDPTKNPGGTQMLANGNQFLLLIIRPSCYSYCQIIFH